MGDKSVLSERESCRAALSRLRDILPRLSPQNHKGSCGRILLVGGSVDFCGAPYFSAISALRCGADLAYVICAPEVALSIKAYSPDLCVLPILTTEPDDLLRAKAMVSSCHAVVMGPGLGDRSIDTLAVAIPNMIAAATLGDIPVVIDTNLMSHRFIREVFATSHPRRMVLTPNVREISMLVKAVTHGDMKLGAEGSNDLTVVQAVANQVGATVIVKGPADLVVDNGAAYIIRVLAEGTVPCPRRVAGQGDILAGVVGCFSMWASMSLKSKGGDETNTADQLPLETAAILLALLTVRTAAQLCFKQHGRSMLASEIVAFIGGAMLELEASAAKLLDDTAEETV